MATTTVTVLSSEGGFATVSAGALTGDSTRDVTVSALQNSSEYVFSNWEIIIEEPQTTGTTTGGTATAGPREEGDSLGGSLPTDDSNTVIRPTDGPVAAF